MKLDPTARSRGGDQEPFEDGFGTGPRVTPIAVAPIARLRSPIFEHRAFEPLPPRDDRPTVLLPPLRTFVGPSGFALLVATPVFLVAGLPLALVVAVVAPVVRAIHRRVSGSTFSFAEGFMAYREPAWPQGVQEDNDVRWNWSAVGNRPGVQG
jgi:hypothetical protein